MHFDRTNGKEERYIVNLYSWDVEDHYYYHSYREAKNLFDKIKNEKHKEGTAISIYDIKNDVRKEFIKF